MEQLADYRENRSSPAEGDALRTHITAGCPACAERLAWIHSTVGANNAQAFPEPPDAVLKKARQLFRERQNNGSVLDVIARLVFNGFAARPAFAGVREGGTDGVQLLFATDDYEIDLWGEEETPGAFYLIGSVRSKTSGTSVALSVASLRRADETEIGARLAVPETAGEFHFPAVAGGVYRLRLHLPETHITLPQVAIGGTASATASQGDG